MPSEKITSHDVKHIASLSRIYLKDKEIESLKLDLENILDYVKKLDGLDTSKTTPTSHIFPLENVYRQDIVIPSLGQEEAIKTAPEKHSGFFKVPKVIE